MEPQPAFRILIVCTGNICRSPVAERILQKGLDAIMPGAVKVSSAGTKAAAGDPAAPFSSEIIHAHGASDVDFQARQLTREILLGHDLMLTMTVKQRGVVIRMEPSLHRRTFTIREFGRMLGALESRTAGNQTAGDHQNAPEIQRAFWDNLPLKAASVRHLALATGAQANDVIDPFGLDRPAFKQMEDELVPALRSILDYASTYAPGVLPAQIPTPIPAAAETEPTTEVAVPTVVPAVLPATAVAPAVATAVVPDPEQEPAPKPAVDGGAGLTPEPEDAVAPVTGSQRGHRVRVRNRKGKQRRARIALAVAAGLVAVSLALAGAFIYNLGKTFDQQTTQLEAAFPIEHSRPPESEAINILVIGSDTDEDEDTAKAEAEEGRPSNQRSDTLMLVHVPADRKNIYNISLMRDLWVDIPDYGMGKINAALAHGGVPLAVRTVESILPQRIDHVVMVDIAGFNRVTDAVDGVDVNVEVGFTSSHLPGHTFTEGPMTLKGVEALAFVRERLAFPEGDYQRVRNQQAFVQGFANKVRDPATLLNPLKITNMVTVMAPFISVDKGLNAFAVGRIAAEVQRVRPESVSMFTLPTKGVSTSPDGQSIVLPDPDAYKQIADALASDSLGEYLKANPGT